MRYRDTFWSRLFYSLAICGVLTIGVGAWAADDSPKSVPGQVLVRFNVNAPNQHLADAMNKAQLHILKHIAKADGADDLVLASTALQVPDAVNLLRNHPAVLLAEPNWIYQHQSTPDDPSYLDGSLWGMYGDVLSPQNQFGSQANEAWAQNFTGSDTVYVGVIDEGLQFDHPDLVGNVWTNPGEIPGNGIDDDGNGYVDDVHGWNALDNNGNIYDPASDDHGTHVSGTIGATGGNGAGVVGVNWNVKIISGKFLGANGGTTADAIEAISYMTKLKRYQGINLVALNNSWGGGGFSQALLDAIADAARENILFVAAAGNGNSLGIGINTDSSPNYPSCYDTTSAAGYDSVIAVSAIDSSGAKATWSNYGLKTVDVGAPGVSILSTLPGGSYGSYSGTSMATPHVTGAAALYASMFPGKNALEIKNALLDSARNTPTASMSTKTVTGGRLNVGYLVPPPPPTAPPAPPANLTATAGNAQVSLAWSAASGATSYTVYRSTSSGGPYSALAANVTSTTFVDNTAANGSTYYYVVSASNSLGESGYSTEVSATPQAPALPAAPSNLSASSVTGKKRISLTWTQSSSAGMTQNKVYRSTASAGPYTLVASISAATSYQDGGLTSGRTYYYVVTAVNSSGLESPRSNIASTVAK